MPVRRFAPIFKRSVGMLVLASYAADGQLGERSVQASSETAFEITLRPSYVSADSHGQ